MPLAQAPDEYLDWQALEKGRSPNTVRAYRADLRIFVTYCAGVDVQQLDQIDRELLRSHQKHLAKPRGTATLSAPTRHRRLLA